MPRPRKWDLADLPKIVEQSYSVREVIKRLGLIPAGGNYAQVQKYIKELELDTSHFTGQGHLRGKTHTYTRRPLSDYTEKGVPIQSHQLRIRLLNDGVFEHRCNKCERTEWLDQPISLELEHKDGNHHNNSLDNLELLCPNCHAQTDTYRGKNVRQKRKGH